LAHFFVTICDTPSAYALCTLQSGFSIVPRIVLKYKHFIIFMVHEKYHEQIRVFSLFDGNKIKPYFFEWNGYRYEIDKIHNIHSGLDGIERFFFFAVSNKSDYFKLKLETKNLHWYIVEHYQE